MRDNFLCDTKVSQFKCSYNVQIWLLSFAPCLTQLFVPPCTDPSTRPHNEGSDVLVTSRLNFWYYYFPFWMFALWNAVPSRPFLPCSWLDLPNLSGSIRLFNNSHNNIRSDYITEIGVHACIYVFASHDSVGNRDSADERGEGRQVQITGVWKCVQTMLHVLCLSQYYHYLLIVQINHSRPVTSHSTTGSQISCKDF
jgi:hypothetical protein